MPASIRHLTDGRINYYSLLAKWKDGLYYSAVLLRCDKSGKRCRVCFEDGSEVWLSNRDIHLQLQPEKLTEEEDIVCCICDDGNSEPPNDIVLCDVCNQGYHQECHDPPVDSSILDGSDDAEHHIDWFCTTCSLILNQSDRTKSEDSTKEQPQSQKQQSSKAQLKLQGATMSNSPEETESHKQEKTGQKSVDEPTQAGKIPNVDQTLAVNPTPKSQTPKVKQTSTLQQQHSTIGPVKSSASHHQRSAPYYPLSGQIRAATNQSATTAALASMAPSSALVVGSSAGRTKQDLVKQSNKSSQRQLQGGDNLDPYQTNSSPPKHAVRKSGMNFVVTVDQPVRQSALPTAMRSTPSAVSTNAKSSYIAQAKEQPVLTVASTMIPTVISSNIKLIPDQQRSIADSIRNGIEFGPVSGMEPRSVVATAAAAASAIAAGNNSASNKHASRELRAATNSHQANVKSSISHVSSLSSSIIAKQVGVIKDPMIPPGELNREAKSIVKKPVVDTTRSDHIHVSVEKNIVRSERNNDDNNEAHEDKVQAKVTEPTTTSVADSSSKD